MSLEVHPPLGEAQDDNSPGQHLVRDPEPEDPAKPHPDL